MSSDKTSGTSTGAADFSGILVLDKPLGLTSMTAVAAVRRRAGGIRTGHAGTLDPLATGVLVMALGRATRSIERFMATDKRYRTEIDLTAFTTTDDREGERTEIAVPNPPDEVTVRSILARFTGTIQQRPPAFSAMKVGGRRAYAAARKGAPMELAPRPVRIDAIELVAYRWPTVTLDIRCGKGFYVRSLARDLGAALGTGGHCASIRRTAVGPYTLDEARSLDALPDRLAATDLLPLEVALARLDRTPSPAPSIPCD